MAESTPDVKRVQERATQRDTAKPEATEQGNLVADSATLQRTLASPGRATPREIQQLQRAVGNRATSRVLAGAVQRRSDQREATGPEAPPEVAAESAQASGDDGPRARLPIQAKLTVTAPDDMYEQEAERVAEQVTSTALPVGQRQTIRPEAQPELAIATLPISRIQRHPGHGDDPVQRHPGHGDDPVQRHADHGEDLLQTASSTEGASGFEAGADVESQLASSRGGGSNLPSSVRESLEPRFGADFSGVRVHTDSQADTLNRQVNARAFTHGADIYFSAGEYSPGTTAGDRLLAHELTHVVQQGASGPHVQRADDGNPVAPADPGTTAHPTVRQGSTGPAVEELQQKLNAAGATPPLVADGVFGPLTAAAVRAFQQQHGLVADAVVGPITWGKIDELGLASTVGRVERQWSEEVGGQTYGMTSRYTWRIMDDQIRTTVKLKFTGLNRPALVEQWFGHIRSIWNHFKAVNQATNESLNIEFDPQSVTSGADNQVRIKPGNGRSDAANWFAEDPDSNNTAAHEFGHMIGLEDEYQRGHTDYKRLTGEDPSPGETTNAAPAGTVATEMRAALYEADIPTRVTKANEVITKYDLKQGDYAQQVAAAYLTANGVRIVDDIVARIPDEDEWTIVDPFTHSSGSLMGMNTTHEHPVEARHVREFVGYIQAVKGGVWKAVPR